ncbi:MGMT family protein [Cellulomonas taurus]|uniref:MGMT family protein n=1 Tax=Cellulomonas taurus TaxID=2729175 RepID=UPI00145CA528|nr:MGMT family protein [Cellulomonas taurus]
MDPEYIAAVRALVRRIPPGRAMTYGLIAEVVADELVAAGGTARGGPRQVGRIMAAGDGDWPWWRVVNAAGSPPAPYAERAAGHWRAEGTPLTADGTRVALRRAVWFPEQDEPGTGRGR